MVVAILAAFAVGFIVAFILFYGKRRKIPEKTEDFGELAHALAHEVKNPLNTILINIQLMKEELGSQKHHESRLSLMESELLRLDRILKAFLDYSHLPRPQFAKLDLNEIVRGVVNIFQTRCEGIFIEARLAENLPQINGDASQITEVLHNLLQNAIESYDGKGVVIIETMHKAGNVIIAITDRGKGIPPEMLDKIFKPYFSTKRGGVGIGMAVVRRIVEVHGGKIQIQSRVDSGTRVIIEFPV